MQSMTPISPTHRACFVQNHRLLCPSSSKDLSQPTSAHFRRPRCEPRNRCRSLCSSKQPSPRLRSQIKAMNGSLATRSTIIPNATASTSQQTSQVKSTRVKAPCLSRRRVAKGWTSKWKVPIEVTKGPEQTTLRRSGRRSKNTKSRPQRGPTHSASVKSN